MEINTDGTQANRCDCKPGDRVIVLDDHSPYCNQTLEVVYVSELMARLAVETIPRTTIAIFREHLIHADAIASPASF